MLRSILWGILFLLICSEHNKSNAAEELYGQPSGRIRAPIPDAHLKNYGKQQYQVFRPLELSPSYIQSRRFHSDQFARDNRDLSQPSSYQSQLLSSYYYPSGGLGSNVASLNGEGCRLTNNFCSRDDQCCSGKCRCVRWSVMGKISCWKKCF